MLYFLLVKFWNCWEMLIRRRAFQTNGRRVTTCRRLSGLAGCFTSELQYAYWQKNGWPIWIKTGLDMFVCAHVHVCRTQRPELGGHLVWSCSCGKHHKQSNLAKSLSGFHFWMDIISEGRQTAAEAMEELFSLACSLSYTAQALCLGMNCPQWPGPSYIS